MTSESRDNFSACSVVGTHCCGQTVTLGSLEFKPAQEEMETFILAQWSAVTHTIAVSRGAVG